MQSHELRWPLPALVRWRLDRDGKVVDLSGPGWAFAGAPQRPEWFVGRDVEEVAPAAAHELARAALTGAPGYAIVEAWGDRWCVTAEPVVESGVLVGVEGWSLRLPPGAAGETEAETYVCRHPIRAPGLTVRPGAFVTFAGDEVVVSEIAPERAVAPIAQHVGGPRLERVQLLSPPAPPPCAPPQPLRLVPR